MSNFWIGTLTWRWESETMASFGTEYSCWFESHENHMKTTYWKAVMIYLHVLVVSLHCSTILYQQEFNDFIQRNSNERNWTTYFPKETTRNTISGMPLIECQLLQIISCLVHSGSRVSSLVLIHNCGRGAKRDCTLELLPISLRCTVLIF